VYHTSTDVNLLRTAYKDIVRLIEQVAKKAGQSTKRLEDQ